MDAGIGTGTGTDIGFGTGAGGDIGFAAGTAPGARRSGARRGVAVVTGASRGLGLALARGLAADGWRLVVTARGAAELAEAAAGLGALTRVVALPGTVADDDHRAHLAMAAEELGGASLLVNNAGTLNGAPGPGRAPLPRLADVPLPDLLETFEVNVLAPIALTQLVLPQLRARAGAVLNISSEAAVVPCRGWGGYGASKAALDLVGGVLAREERELRVWTVDPGSMRTRMLREAAPGEDLSGAAPPEQAAQALLALIRDRGPSGRYRAADLAATRPA
ncbi:SDR family NAD(P)-dependent oxidoreductase [Kitasatospora sp. NPDC018619]|uniref:SDR family NAD(P)-dependent oxidoreductase n=1 Tax=unclassified Kitasatospora TaxID=2633591 RepID=UPI0037A54C5F